MKKIDEMLWQLSMATQSPEKLGNEELIDLYAMVRLMKKNAETPQQKQCAEHIFSVLENEKNRRDLKFLAFFVIMDEEGNFLEGREELKNFLASMEFEQRMEIVDPMLEECSTEEQRRGLLELSRELLYS